MAKLSRESLQRLGELNRNRLKSAKERPEKEEILQPKVPRSPGARNHSTAGFIDPPDEITGREVEMPSGKFLLIRRDLAEIWDAAERFASHYCLVFNRGAIGVDIDSLHEDVRRFCEVDHNQLLYLDIETCGLSSVPVFLVGVQQLVGERLVLEQYLARDYSEEKPMLEYFWGKMAEFEAVTTYNGKSFDVPFLRDRAVYHGVPHVVPGFHLDLLHEARRRFKGQFPNCKLQTLEARLCNRLRRGDIPGELIPKAYHDFVRTKDPQLIRNVIHHNALDIVTMSEVLLRLLSGL
ncbi:MAG: ribonuclease H-like domain-containing protein [Candidatus Coatesbacteria bacterium]|nr:ribonuclease H-like domain-containing protein [Candidatus Coatesbacteria bacterium]